MTEPEWVGIDDFSSIAAPPPNSTPDETSWTPIHLGELPDVPPEKPTLGGMGLVYPGKRHVFSGPQESAKTLAAYALALEVARTDRHIILIDFEMGRYDARNRLRDLQATDRDFDWILYLEPHEPAKPDTMQALIARDPALVIIDAAAGAYDLQGLDDNKRQDVEKFTRLYVHEFWRHEIATIVLDHVVKQADNRGTYAIGSERKVGGADVHLGFTVITPIQRGHTGLYKITTHKDRGGYLKRGTLAHIELASDPVSHTIAYMVKPAEEVPPGETWLPTIYMERVSRYLQNASEECSRTHLEENIEGTAEYIRTAIDHLVRLDYAVENSGPRRSRMYVGRKLFTTIEWENNPHSVGPSDSVGTPSATGSDDSVGPTPPLRGRGDGVDGVNDEKNSDSVGGNWPELWDSPPPDESLAPTDPESYPQETP